MDRVAQSVKRLATCWTVRGSNSGGGEIFRTCPERPWGLPSLLYNEYRVLSGVKSGRGVTLSPHPLLVPWSRKSRAIPLFRLWAVRPVQSLSACTRVHFTFTFLLLVTDSVVKCTADKFTVLHHASASHWKLNVDFPKWPSCDKICLFNWHKFS